MQPTKRNDETLAMWVFENASPVVRYRTARELLAQTPVDIPRLRQELMASPLVRLWLGRLKDCTRIHDSGNDRFENIVGKLLEFGLDADCREFSELLRPFALRLDREPGAKHGMMFVLSSVIIAWGLARAGVKDSLLEWFMRQRLDILYETACNDSYDIYYKGIEFKDMPKAYREHYSVIKEEFAPNGESRLPGIHDLYLLAAMQDAGPDAETAAKIERVVSYVLQPEYQALDQGFGYVRESHKDGVHYYVLGWAAQLPGYNAPLKKGKPSMLLQRLELMCHFPVARGHEWVLRSIDYLNQYKVKNGRWLFPREYLTEKPVGYWVAGAHMGLEEDRRSELAMEVESTFRMLKIKSLMRKTMQKMF